MLNTNAVKFAPSATGSKWAQGRNLLGIENLSVTQNQQNRNREDLQPANQHNPPKTTLETEFDTTAAKKALKGIIRHLAKINPILANTIENFPLTVAADSFVLVFKTTSEVATAQIEDCKLLLQQWLASELQNHKLRIEVDTDTTAIQQYQVISSKEAMLEKMQEQNPAILKLISNLGLKLK